PTNWFSGHMHVKYSAIREHEGDTIEDAFKDLAISDELRAQLPNSMFRAASSNIKGAPKSPPPDITNTVTHFLALDKPGGSREFLELAEIKLCSDVGDDSADPYLQKTPEGKFTLHYDEEWLSITRSFADRLMVKYVSLNKTKSE